MENFMKEGIFNRTELLLGKETTQTIAEKKVIISVSVVSEAGALKA